VVLDRTRNINWWTGRLSDAELAEFARMEKRNLQLVLSLPKVRAEIAGGGRGSRGTRRISHKVRNGVAMIQALHEAKLTLAEAGEIIGTFWYLPDTVNRAVDFSPVLSGIRSPMIEDPAGGWLLTDSVPDHIAERYVIPCRRVDLPAPASDGDLALFPADFWRPDSQTGHMIVPTGPESSVELVPLSPEPIYYGEIDPIGQYLPGNTRPESLPWDDHLEIINSRWIYHRVPEPDAYQVVSAMFNGEWGGAKKVAYRTILLGELVGGRSPVRSLRDADDATRARAEYERENFHSRLEINLSLPVRKMKRRALGLAVDGDGTPRTSLLEWLHARWPEPVKAPPPGRFSEPKAAPAAPKLDFFGRSREHFEFMRAIDRDELGREKLVGLSVEETVEYFNLVDARFNDSDDWDRDRDPDRYLELHGKHEAARRRAIAARAKERMKGATGPGGK
jgi:hypothetical protein